MCMLHISRNKFTLQEKIAAGEALIVLIRNNEKGRWLVNLQLFQDHRLILSDPNLGVISPWIPTDIMEKLVDHNCKIIVINY